MTQIDPPVLASSSDATAAHPEAPDISVVLLARNKQGNSGPLIRGIRLQL